MRRATVRDVENMRGTLRPLINGLAGKWRWRFNRLRCMSIPEIGHRICRGILLQIESAGLLIEQGPPVPDFSRDSVAWISAAAIGRPEHYIATAQRVMAGRFDIFAIEDVFLGVPPAWNRDPRTGIEGPMTFGKVLDYRDPTLVGDIKYLWETNRHLHIVTLAQSYKLTADLVYLRAIRTHLESWFAECPYPLGPNWSSSLEPAIRLINWSLAWQLVGGLRSPMFAARDGQEFRGKWLQSIYQHSEYINGHFSLYSSANNHLTGEATGLFVASVTWPYWQKSSRWAQKARNIIEREAVLQNSADGVNREQAVSYQQFVLDFLLLAGLAGRANGIQFGDAYWARIEAMLEYLASIMDVAGNVPMIGDADDGFVVRLSMQPDFDPYRSLLATGAVVFKRADFRVKAGSLDEKTKWLLGDEAEKVCVALSTAAPVLPPRRAFPEGGYYVLGSDFETADEIRVVADAGPLGYQAIAAHGHADALSFTLSVGGDAFLIDPGTYAYHTQKPWRDYFRGTSAHNTVRVDGLDQSVSGGNFLWLQKANAACEVWEPGDDTDVFQGTHDGYARLVDPVIHRRRITLQKKRRLLLIDDTIECVGSHRIELFWHFSEHCDVGLEGRLVLAQAGGKTVALSLPEAREAECRLYRGSTAPIAGWVSRRFDHKVPTTTIVWEVLINGRVGVQTGIQCDALQDSRLPDSMAK
jgi:hypothetical protein